jgi:hypothetical protein
MDTEAFAQIILDDEVGGELTDLTDAERRRLAAIVRRYGVHATLPPEEPPQRRGPFQPGGASAVRGVPLGNLNIRPSITAEAFKGPDRQPVSNFLQQVKSMPGVTQEGLKTGLMAFANMDPSRQITKAEFARELLPSSYDIVDLANSSHRNVHDLEYLDDLLDDDDVLDQFKETHNIPANLRDDIATYTQYDEFSGALQKYLAKKGIRNEEEFNDAIAAVRKEMVDAQYEEYLAENYPEEDNSPNLDPYQYRKTQRLVKDDASTQYMEFGVAHPDQTKSYTHYPEAPEGVIGHIRGSYNVNKPDIRKTDGKGFVGKPNSFVIEEIQSDAQKGREQKAHLHQAHGVLFKAAIQKALESGANTVYLPTAETIASIRRDFIGWEEGLDDQGLIMQVPTFGEVQPSKFKPIYDQAIVKEGLKPLLKISGVTSKMVNGYHEISFTQEAKEYILNGPGQTIPGYKKGGWIRKYEKGGSIAEEANKQLRETRQPEPRPDPVTGRFPSPDISRMPERTMVMPRYMHLDKDYPAVGTRLSANKRLDNNSMVTGYIDADTTKAPGEKASTRASGVGVQFLHSFAKGGTVRTIPSVEQMQYELMMRRK